MSSSSSTNHTNQPITNGQLASYTSSSPTGSGPNPNNTTFVQADPSNFRQVVQRLTGASPKLPLDAPPQKLHAHAPPRSPARKPNSGEMGPRRPAFKLHERRQAARKLEISLHHHGGAAAVAGGGAAVVGVPVLFSPVSPLEMLAVGGGGGNGTPRTPKEEEERAIAEKRYYFHPSPLSAARTGWSEPPELLPLFPLHSPRDQEGVRR